MTAMDFRQYQSITINGALYTKETIDQVPDYDQGSLRGFLKDWMSDHPEITVQTSGSTGVPKSMQVAKNAMLVSADRTLNFFGLAPEMTALLCLPTSFIAGKMMVVRALLGQLRLITTPPSGRPLQDLSTNVDLAAFTPMQMLNELKVAQPKLRHLKNVLIGGGKVDAQLDRMLQNQPFSAYETYGMTETLSHIALRRINGIGRQSAFVPLENVRIHTDPRGCLTLDASGITEGSMVTNDLAAIQPDGTFIILGRADHIINSGGIKISPETLEDQIRHLLTVPFILSAIDHETLGQQIVLVTEGEPAHADTLLYQIKPLLPQYQYPKHLYTLPLFPKTESGKIKRHDLTMALKKKHPFYSCQ
jgi:O-succinylbenzoic acid--CoA ligase